MSLMTVAVLLVASAFPPVHADDSATRKKLLADLFEEREPTPASPLDCLSGEERALLARIFSEVEEKEAALDVAQTHRKQPGERVVVRGRIIGAERLFEEHEALFVIADPAYVVPDDLHAHPYRAGTVPAEVKRAHTLAVQILNGEGHILPLGLKGLHGLKEMDYVVVAGTIDAESTASSPVVNADAIEIVGQWPMEAPSVEENPQLPEASCIPCAEGVCAPEPHAPALEKDKQSLPHRQ